LSLIRLITWNCKGAYWKKHGFISALHPDVVVVPEFERRGRGCEKVVARTMGFG